MNKLILLSVISFLFIGTGTSEANFYQLQIAKYSDTQNEIVYYNTQSHKYHKMSCIWAKKCTKNCIPIKRSEAITRGVPCKVCGG
jgi:diphthamide synthase subunit DPH2